MARLFAVLLMVLGVLFMMFGGLSSLGFAVILIFGLDGPPSNAWAPSQIGEILTGLRVEVVLPLVIGYALFACGRRLGRTPPPRDPGATLN